MPIAEPDCPFCPDNGKVKIIAEDGDVYLVESLTPGRYLIVPMEHATSVDELPYDFMGSVSNLLGHVPWPTPGVAYNLSANFGKAAGQTKDHLHMWVVPRDEDPSMPSYGKGTAALVDEVNKAAAQQ